MTEDELQAIEARANAATSQPWEACKLSEGLGYVYSSGLGDVVAGSSSAAFLLDDAEFIAAARTDVPTLVAEVRRLREANKKIYEELQKAHDRATQLSYVAYPARNASGE